MLRTPEVAARDASHAGRGRHRGDRPDIVWIEVGELIMAIRARLVDIPP